MAVRSMGLTDRGGPENTGHTLWLRTDAPRTEGEVRWSMRPALGRDGSCGDGLPEGVAGQRRARLSSVGRRCSS